MGRPRKRPHVDAAEDDEPAGAVTAVADSDSAEMDIDMSFLDETLDNIGFLDLLGPEFAAQVQDLGAPARRSARRSLCRASEASGGPTLGTSTSTRRAALPTASVPAPRRQRPSRRRVCRRGRPALRRPARRACPWPSTRTRCAGAWRASISLSTRCSSSPSRLARPCGSRAMPPRQLTTPSSARPARRQTPHTPSCALLSSPSRP